MTKTQITEAAQRDSEQIGNLIEAIRTGSDDTAQDLIERLILAARADAIDDVIVELRSEGMTAAAKHVKTEF